MLRNLIIRTPCRASVQRISMPKGMKITGQIECYLNRTYRLLPTIIDFIAVDFIAVDFLSISSLDKQSIAKYI